MTNIANNNDKNKIIVLSISAIAAILIIMYVVFSFSSSGEELSPGEDQEMVLNENGEASYLNLSVPNSVKDEDSLSLIDNLEKIKQDSINSKKINTSGLENTNNLNSDKNYDAYSYVNNNKIKGRKYESSRAGGGSSSYKSTYSKPSYTSYEEDYNYSSRNKENITSSDSHSELEKKENIVKENIVKENKTENNNSNSATSVTGFFNSKKNKKNNILTSDKNIMACIHSNQVIMNNQRVKFRTTKEFTYNNETFPINTIIYGTAFINPNRLIVKINNINQTPIKLEVFDSEDSEKGIYVLTPNLNATLQKEFNKEAIDDSDLRRIPFSKTLKSLFEKKIKEEKVQLLNNYKVIIKITKDDE